MLKDRRNPAPASAQPLPPFPLYRLVGGGLDLACGGEIRHVHKNTDIIIAGRHYQALFVNHGGWLFRYKILHNGDRQIMDFILPGQIFGLQACLFKTALYSVAAATDVLLSSVSLEAIDRVFEDNPPLARALFWSAACESAIIAEHLIDTARRSAYERVSHFLLELLVRLKATGVVEGMSFEMPLTQELIGGALGLTTVHVNRTLRALREDGLIAIEGRRVTILDFEALSLICDFDSSYLGEAARTLRGEMAPSGPAAQPRRHIRSAVPPSRLI
ncbi:MAG: Crp/Fnr family transcriptional regulator [Xanthobacteraceae bacterium]|nr:MAG: Crp/Fnr family transcriptional regulator [Xanthobacteraceae bacterium]